MCAAFRKEIGEHLKVQMSDLFNDAINANKYLNSVKGTTRAFGMELDAPHLLTRVSSRLDTFHRRVIAVNEEGLPASGERVLELQRILVILTEGGVRHHAQQIS